MAAKYFITFFALTAWLVFSVNACKPDAKAEEKSEATVETATFVGSTQCKSCHSTEFDAWHQSDHFKAMALATDSTVLGNFTDATFSADGVKTSFFKKEGRFYINTEGETGTNQDFEVKYTFGHYPLQQYLVAFTNGRMQPTRASWNSRDGRWFNQYAGEKIAHTEWLHWTGNGQNWNTMCATCHSTNLHKNYDFATDSYKTTFSEISVGCESCHGPGSAHVAVAEKGNYKSAEHSTFVFGKGGTNKTQLNTCAPCHARKSDISANPMHTGELLDDYIPQLISNDFYYADGQIMDENFEYGSFTQSKMYGLGIGCSNCHNPHSGKKLAEGNALCMSCHQPKYNTTQHHFHEESTPGAQCINCHMPERTYMGNDHRRDHSFRIPRPDQSAKYGTPNACSSCHSNQSNQWAAQAVNTWYGPKRVYHFSDDLLPGSLLDDKSETHLIKLLRDTAQPAIARATAAHYLAQIPTTTAFSALNEALKRPEALIRYHAVLGITHWLPSAWFQPLAPLLADEVRAVRIAAAAAYHQAGGVQNVPATWQSAYSKADAENRDYVHYQTDFSVGNAMAGDYYAQAGNAPQAIAFYERALQKDDAMNYARQNLATMHSTLGNNAEALRALQYAVGLEPENDQLHYNLALLYLEMEKPTEAAVHFKKALALNTQITGVYYNYALLLQSQEKPLEAEKMLKKGLKISPTEEKLLYALAVLYINQGKAASAKNIVQQLVHWYPENEAYQRLMQSIVAN